MGFKALLFDKDGTLLDYEASWSGYAQVFLKQLSGDDPAVALRMAELVGINLKTGQFAANSIAVGGTLRDVFEAVKTISPSLTWEQALQADQTALKVLKPVPFFDLAPYLTSLKERYRLSIITNDNEGATHHQLHELGLSKLFDDVICADSGYTPKPAGDMLLGVAQRAGLSAKELVMIGDSTHDLMAGRAANVGLCVGVTSGPASGDDLRAYADYILDDISQLPALLEKFL